MKQPLYSGPRPNPDAPWSVDEAVRRLRHVLRECRCEYQFCPTDDDSAALDFLEDMARLSNNFECD